MTTEDPDWDDAAIDRLRNLGGNELLGKMIELFLQGAPKRVSAALAGAEAGDWPAVEHATHSLKSSAANVGARGLSKLCEQIEQLSSQKEVADISKLMLQLEPIFDQVKARLAAIKGLTP